jgi:hypothetical protein
VVTGSSAAATVVIVVKAARKHSRRGRIIRLRPLRDGQSFLGRALT